MMNNDESPRPIMPYQQTRKPYQSKYQDNRYTSPSANYNYNSGNGYAGQQQHPRRRVDRFKRETINYSERIMHQNDLIIRLLKEIRDRLPAPAVSVTVDTGETDQTRHNGRMEEHGMADSGVQVDNLDGAAEQFTAVTSEQGGLDETLQTGTQPSVQ
jgi:hypothetical protein